MPNILELLDRPIAYHRVFAEMAGSVTAGVFLSQAVYWSRRTSDPSGFFYKSRDQWTAETFLTRSEQETARKALRSIGVLIEKRGGEDNRLYFRIDADRLTELLVGRQDSRQPVGRILPSGRQDSRRPSMQRLQQRLHHRVFYRALHATGKKLGGVFLILIISLRSF